MANSDARFMTSLRGSTKPATKKKSCKTNLLTERSNKENIRRGNESASLCVPGNEIVKPIIEEAVDDEDQSLAKKIPIERKEGLLHSPRPEERPSKIRDQSKSSYDKDLLEEVSALMGYKMTAKKYEFTKVMQEQSALIKRQKKALFQMRARSLNFVEGVMRVEDKLQGDNEILSGRIMQSDQSQEAMDLEIEGLKMELQQSQAELSAAHIEAEKVKMTLNHLTGKYDQIQSSKQAVDIELEAMKQQLEQTRLAVENHKNEVQVVQGQVEEKKSQIASLQVDHRQQQVQQQQDFNDKMDRLRLELSEEREQKFKLAQTKTTLEEKVQESAVTMATLTGEIARAEQNTEIARKDNERLQKEIETLVGKIKEKTAENANALESFNRSQRFNEQRTTTLCNEKRELETKLTVSLTQKAQLDEQLKNMTATLQASDNKLRQTEQTLLSTRETLTAQLQTVRTELEVSRSQQKSQQKAFEEKIESLEQAAELQMLNQRNAFEEQISQLTESHTAKTTEWNAKEVQMTMEAKELTHSSELLQQSLSTLTESSSQKISELETQSSELQTQRDSLEKECMDLKKVVASQEEISQQAQQSLKIDIAALTTEKADLLAKLERVEHELSTFRAHCGTDDAQQLQQLVKVSMEVDLLRKQLSGKENLAKSLTDAKSDIEELKGKLYHAEVARRQLHNKMQEMRGNVRVHVRVRPFLKGDGSPDNGTSLDCSPNLRNVVLTNAEKTYPFEFDHIFSPATKQQEVFDEVAGFVQSALDGYYVCLFSYGQTGSGKTFSMQGADMGNERGIIPRSIEKVMEEAKRLQGEGWTYTLEATFMEIYNETVRDLLTDSSEKKSLPIKMDSDGGACVPDLNRFLIEEREQISELMKKANKSRSVAKTDMNSQSSRSHSIFQLHLTGTNQVAGVVVKGCLNLCDLAGSERLSRSGVTGDRLKETQAINKSLSAISDIFQALSSKSSHIPYRNTKLTHILSKCFSDQGKTLMMVNLSPTVESSNESLCSLRFASKVNQTEIAKPGKAVKNIKRVSREDSGGGEEGSGPRKRPKDRSQNSRRSIVGGKS